MALLTRSTNLAFFGFDSPGGIHCFHCWLISYVLWWVHVSFMAIKQLKHSPRLWLNNAKRSLEVVTCLQFSSIVNKCLLLPRSRTLLFPDRLTPYWCFFEWLWVSSDLKWVSRTFGVTRACAITRKFIESLFCYFHQSSVCYWTC